MANVNKLLILGSMEEFVQLVEMAHARGIYTIVCDGYADGPARQFADKVYTVDIHDASSIAEICRIEKVDGIITAYSDVLAECAARIADEAGLRFYLKPEQIGFLRDKARMKQMFCDLQIPYPKSAHAFADSCIEDIEGLRYPVVVKPLDGWGSHGVYLARSAAEVVCRFSEVAQYSSTNSIIVEEYNDGYEFNMMCWVVDGNPVVLEIADREKSIEVQDLTPHVSRIVYPSIFTDFVLQQATDYVTRIVKYIGMDSGPLCMQFFWSPQNSLQVCECAGRIFGYEHELLEFASDGVLSIEDLLLDYVCEPDNIRNRLSEHDPHLPRVAAGLYFHGYEGAIEEMSGIPSVEPATGILSSIAYYNVGDQISHALGSKPYIARLYISGDSRSEVDNLTDMIFEGVTLRGPDGRSLLYHNERTRYEELRGRCDQL